MKKTIYMTYCCKAKARILDNHKVFPAELYRSPRIRTFISFCNENNYRWAIFSDKYGLVFKDEKISWYDKSPEEVTQLEYSGLLSSAVDRLQNVDLIFFYYCDESFHPLYRCLVQDLETHKQIRLISNLEKYDATD